MVKACTAVAFTLSLLLSALSAEEPWREDSNSNGVLIQSRPRGNAGLREFRATGNIDAPPARIRAVLTDADAYPQFMPYVSQCRVLKRDRDSVNVFQRLVLPLLHDRDFTLLTRFEES